MEKFVINTKLEKPCIPALTTKSRFILEKLIVTQLAKILSGPYDTIRPIMSFTGARWSLSTHAHPLSS
jgi:hypothetical protein